MAYDRLHRTNRPLKMFGMGVCREANVPRTSSVGVHDVCGTEILLAVIKCRHLSGTRAEQESCIHGGDTDRVFDAVVVLHRKHGQPIGAVTAPFAEALRMHHGRRIRGASHYPWGRKTWASVFTLPAEQADIYKALAPVSTVR